MNINKVKPKTALLSSVFVLMLSGVLSLPAYAQGFDLFDPDRGKPPPPPPVQNAAPQKTVIPKAQPKINTPPPRQNDFILRGTARIGNKFTAVLEAHGKKVFLKWRPGSQIPVPPPVKGYEDFILRSVKPREVELIYPTKFPCQKSDQKKNLKCSSDGKIGTLTLNRARPTPPRRPPVAPPPPRPATPHAAAPPGSRAPPIPPTPRPTPSAMPTPNAAPNPNTPQEAPPPGMKRVRTPFGDRFVPDR